MNLGPRYFKVAVLVLRDEPSGLIGGAGHDARVGIGVPGEICHFRKVALDSQLRLPNLVLFLIIRDAFSPQVSCTSVSIREYFSLILLVFGIEKSGSEIGVFVSCHGSQSSYDIPLLTLFLSFPQAYSKVKRAGK